MKDQICHQYALKHFKLSGLRKSQLALKMDTSPSQVGYLLAGERSWTGDWIQRFCLAIGIPLKNFFNTTPLKIGTLEEALGFFAWAMIALDVFKGVLNHLRKCEELHRFGTSESSNTLISNEIREALSLVRSYFHLLNKHYENKIPRRLIDLYESINELANVLQDVWREREMPLEKVESAEEFVKESQLQAQAFLDEAIAALGMERPVQEAQQRAS